MINSDELRIGNFVLDENGNYKKIIGLLSGQIIVLIDNSPVGRKEELYNPVPLTPEILEQCGFEKIGNGCYLKSPIVLTAIGPIDVQGTFFFEWPADSWDNNQEDNIVDVPSLHQLQNLYFALTGEELTIKEFA